MFATTLTATFNSGLVASIDALATADGLDIRTLDAFALLDEEVAKPSAFGFTDVTTPCWTGTFFGTGGTLCTTSPSGQDAHLFWDSIHPTEAGHSALADAALRAIPEPPGALLWLGGLGALAVVRTSAARRASGR
jgi:outer membrane lipase/esterase